MIISSSPPPARTAIEFFTQLAELERSGLNRRDLLAVVIMTPATPMHRLLADVHFPPTGATYQAADIDTRFYLVVHRPGDASLFMTTGQLWSGPPTRAMVDHYDVSDGFAALITDAQALRSALVAFNADAWRFDLRALEVTAW